jgi:hypothetical protein
MFNNALSKAKGGDRASDADEDLEYDIPRRVYHQPLTFCSLFGELEDNIKEVSLNNQGENRTDSEKKAVEQIENPDTLPLSSKPLASTDKQAANLKVNSKTEDASSFKVTLNSRENRLRRPANSRYEEKVHQDTKETTLLISTPPEGLKRKIKSRPRENRETVELKPKASTPKCKFKYPHSLVKKQKQSKLDEEIMENLPLEGKKDGKQLEETDEKAVHDLATNLTAAPAIENVQKIAAKPFDIVDNSAIPSLGNAQQKRKAKPRMKTKAEEEPKSKSVRHHYNKESPVRCETSKSTKIIGDISDSDKEDGDLA